MSIINQIDAILNSVKTNIVLFIVLIVFLVGTFFTYKKENRIKYYYYAKGFFFILLSFLIGIAKDPLITGSLLELTGLAILVFFLGIGLYNIFYLADKKKSN